MLIQKEQNHQYIIIEELQNMDEFALQMITENQIPGLIVCRQQIFNGERNLYYDITGKQPLSDSTVKLSGADLRCLLQSLLLTLESLSSYFLPPDGISFDLDTVFLENDMWSFCYVPEREGQMNKNSIAFSQELLGKVNQDDEQAVVLVYQFYQMIKRKNDTLHYVLLHLLYGDENCNENMDTYEPRHKEDDGRIPQNKRKEDRDEMRIDMRTASIPEVGQRNTVAEEAVLSETLSEIPAQEGRSGKVDKTTLLLFVMVCLCSLGYGFYTALTWQVSTLQELCRLRQGILSIVFFILAVCGILGTCLLPQCSRFFSEKNRTIEQEKGQKMVQEIAQDTRPKIKRKIKQGAEQRIEKVTAQNEEQEAAYEVPPINI